jgi:hypothetical protein
MMTPTRPDPTAVRTAPALVFVACGAFLVLALAAPIASAGGPACASAGACAAHCAAAARATCTVAASNPSSTCSSAAATTAATQVTAPAAPAVPGEAALRAERDTETGGFTLAPLWESSMSLTEATSKNFSSDGLVFQVLPTGGVGVNLQGRFQSYSIARRTLDGEIQSGCTDSPASLFEWFYGLTPSTPPVARTER